ncbi:GNAT family N-acetyltransferase [Asaia krungthepensis]|uniref:Acetyltransferase n=1 Tax=Asaia krungthepensis NRIC 0535 TaxID=1307925 RepID=A0ABQ0Q5U0_9PROT|nr:GNAT family N-acetyltransferase [Asaia krungthepensis]GBQ92700.1 acetyltransferase [Asaia krungthepensis NRIC 0535]
MSPAIRLARIATDDCLPLRREVLWPGLTEEECRVPQDPEATHLGAFDGDRLVGCLSLCPIGPGLVQLRKFAVVADLQGQGIGAQMMHEAIAICRKAGVGRLELDARSSALGFYRKFGMVPMGEIFFKGPIEHQRMALDLRT